MEKFFSLEQRKSQARYNKRVGELVNPPLTNKILRYFKEIPVPHFSGLSKDDIIRIDAELERDARFYAEGKNSAHKDYRHMEKLRNSDLTIVEPYSPKPEHAKTELKGEINGKKVQITKIYFGKGETPEYTGMFNGKKINHEEAQQLFDEYAPIAKLRMNALKEYKEYIKNSIDYTKLNDEALEKAINSHIEKQEFEEAAKAQKEKMRREKETPTQIKKSNPPEIKIKNDDIDYSKIKDEELDTLLDKYLREEEYLKAAAVRDENIRRGRMKNIESSS